jgi:hypothetical protein
MAEGSSTLNDTNPSSMSASRNQVHSLSPTVSQQPDQSLVNDKFPEFPFLKTIQTGIIETDVQISKLNESINEKKHLQPLQPMYPNAKEAREYSALQNDILKLQAEITKLNQHKLGLDKKAERCKSLLKEIWKQIVLAMLRGEFNMKMYREIDIETKNDVEQFCNTFGYRFDYQKNYDRCTYLISW